MNNWEDRFYELIEKETQLLLTDGDCALLADNMSDIRKIKSFICKIEKETKEKAYKHFAELVKYHKFTEMEYIGYKYSGTDMSSKSNGLFN